MLKTKDTVVSDVKLRENILINNEDSVTSPNKLIVVGRIIEEVEYNHTSFYKKFYKTKIAILRDSGVADNIPVIISEKLIRRADVKKGQIVQIKGQFRSRNEIGSDGKRHLVLYIFAKDVIKYNVIDSTNLLRINGFVCKEPIYRQTPMGREITDILLAVNRPFENKTDYIPCIAWGKTAKWAKLLKVGDRVILYGRIQSRIYYKENYEKPEEGEYREAYEISAIGVFRA